MKLANLYNLFASHKEGNWIISQPNAKKLYDTIKKYDVKRILDLGTGIGASSAIIALALEEKGVKDYEIHTIEQFNKCYNLAQELIPKELNKNIKFYLSDAITWKTNEIPYTYFSVYEELPEGHWDLILNDGPGPWLQNEKLIDIPDGNILKMLIEKPDLLRTGDKIAWDGRINTLRTIERFFGDNFYISDMEPRFNVIERKDNQLKLNDVKIKEMFSVNYFNDHPRTSSKKH